MSVELLEQHLCDKKDWGYVELKQHPRDGWILWMDDEPLMEVNYCPYCGEDLDPQRIYMRAI